MIIAEVFLLLVIALFFRVISREWTAPGALFALYWFVGVAVPVLFSPGFSYSSSAIGWIIISVITLGMGAMIGGFSKTFKPTNITEVVTERYENVHKAVIVFSFLGFLGALVLLRSMGTGLSVFFSLDTLQNVAFNSSVERYSSGSRPPMLYTLLSAFPVAASYLGGVLWALQKKKVAFLPFIPILMCSVVSTAKAGLIFQIVMWVAGWLSCRVQLGKTNIPRSLIIRGSVSALALSGIFIFTFALRYNAFNKAGLSLIYDKMAVYYFGYLSGFSQWFDSANYHVSDLGYGSSTLAGLFDVLGIVQRKQGIFDQPVVIGDYSTNIYTLLRYLIEDFGYSGSLVILFFIGLASGFIYQKVKGGSRVCLSLLMMLYAQMLFSNTTTIFGYNTMILAWIISAFVVIMSKRSAKFNYQEGTVPSLTR